jgi:quinol monooxygenase YgiN
MATLYVHHKVKNYSEWRKVFDDLTAMRTSYGCTGHQVFQSPSDPNEITILTGWKTIDQAKSYATSNDLKEGMKNAGVISQPDVAFLVEA